MKAVTAYFATGSSNLLFQIADQNFQLFDQNLKVSLTIAQKKKV